MCITQNTQAIDINVRDPNGYYRCDYNAAWKECCSESTTDGYKSLVENLKAGGYANVNVTIDDDKCNKIIYIQYSDLKARDRQNKITYYVGKDIAGCPKCTPATSSEKRTSSCECDRTNSCNTKCPFPSGIPDPDCPYNAAENCACDPECTGSGSGSGTGSGSGSGTDYKEPEGQDYIKKCNMGMVTAAMGTDTVAQHTTLDNCWMQILAYPSMKYYLYPLVSSDNYDLNKGSGFVKEDSPCCLSFLKAGCASFCKYEESSSSESVSDGLSDFFTGDCDICDYLAATKKSITEIAADAKTTAANTTAMSADTKAMSADTKAISADTKAISDDTKAIAADTKAMPANISKEMYSKENLEKLSDAQYKNLEKFLLDFGCIASSEPKEGTGKRDDCRCDTTTGCDKIDDPAYSGLPDEFGKIPQIDCYCDIECNATEGDAEKNSICEYLSATKTYQKNMPKNVAEALIGEPSSSEGNPLEAIEKEMETESKEMETFYDSECTGTDCSESSGSKFEQYKGSLTDKIIYDSKGDEARQEIVEKNFEDKMKIFYDEVVKESPILNYFKNISIVGAGECKITKIQLIKWETFDVDFEFDICQWTPELIELGKVLKIIAIIASFMILVK